MDRYSDRGDENYSRTRHRVRVYSDFRFKTKELSMTFSTVVRPIGSVRCLHLSEHSFSGLFWILILKLIPEVLVPNNRIVLIFSTKKHSTTTISFLKFSPRYHIKNIRLRRLRIVCRPQTQILLHTRFGTSSVSAAHADRIEKPKLKIKNKKYRKDESCRQTEHTRMNRAWRNKLRRPLKTTM